MSAHAGGPGSSGRADRSWLLGCEGMRVDCPDGPVGVVVAPIYEPSARWDRPTALRVAAGGGTILVPIELVASASAHDRRIILSEAPIRRGV